MMAKDFEGVPRFDYEAISRLIPKAHDGHDGARDKLLNLMQGYLVSHASENWDESLRQKVSPEDIAQQALTQIIQNFLNFRGKSSAEFWGWVKVIVQNEIGEARRFHAGKRK